jgi:hypothetical protein
LPSANEVSGGSGEQQHSCTGLWLFNRDRATGLV